MRRSAPFLTIAISMLALSACSAALPQSFPLAPVAPPASTLCDANDLCSVFPSPGGTDLRGVAVAGADVLAVGEGGVVLRWHGGSWSRVAAPTSEQLDAICADGTAAWIAGEHGTLLHWNGETLSPVATDTTADLHAVASLGDRVFAAGDHGTIIESANGHPKRHAAATSENLSGLWADRATQDLWAVGAKGTVLHMHGDVWSVVPPPSPGDLFSVGGAAADVWVSGADGTYRREGDHWSRESDARLLSIQTTPDGRAWGMAIGEFFVEKGGRWETAGRAPRDAMTFGGAVGAAGDAWAVGDRGNVFHGGPSGWDVSAPDPAWWSEADPSAGISGIYSAGGRVWAIGFNLGILAWDGTTWQHDASVHRMNAIAGTGPSDVWVVGDGAIHWDGRTWQRFEDGLDATLWSVAVFGPADVWAGGGRGYVAHFDGRSWDGTKLPARDIVSVWGTSSHDVWAIDFDGRTFHSDGESWTLSSLLPKGAQPPKAMWGSRADDVWMVTETGALHRTPTGVTSATLVGRDALLTSVAGTGPDDVWVGGLRRNNATLHHWDGKTWSETTSHPQGEISALFMDENGTLWVGTENGCIYEKTRNTPFGDRLR